MNQTTSQPGASLLPETTDLFTAANFAIIAVLMLLVVAGIVYGTRLARARRLAALELREHNEEVAQHAPPPPADDAPPATRASAPTELLPDARKSEEGEAAAPTAPAEVARSAGGLPADGPLSQLKGLGPKLETRLAELGITTIGQIAALTDDEAQALDAKLGPFTGRLTRDRWQEQARFLAAGDRKGFEAVFGRL